MSILSRQEVFTKESDITKLIVDTDGSRFVVNEIIINFVKDAIFTDAQNIADLIGGRIVGFIKSANAYQIEVITNTPEELEIKIQIIRQLNSPLIEGVFRDYILNIF